MHRIIVHFIKICFNVEADRQFGPLFKSYGKSNWQVQPANYRTILDPDRGRSDRIIYLFRTDRTLVCVGNTGFGRTDVDRGILRSRERRA